MGRICKSFIRKVLLTAGRCSKINRLQIKCSLTIIFSNLISIGVFFVSQVMIRLRP